MKLFEWALIFTGERRTSKEDSPWKRKPEILAFERCLARDESEAQILAARAIPETYAEELDRITIVLRPF